MRSEGYCSSVSVCLCVCLFQLICNPRPKQRYQRPQCYMDIVLNGAFFLKRLRSKVMAWNTSEKGQYANKFEFTADCFRAVSRSTKHGNYLMDNWWAERCLRGYRGRQPLRSEKIDRALVARAHAVIDTRMRNLQAHFTITLEDHACVRNLFPLLQLFYSSI